ncbi:MAG: hypothetical protein OSA99_07665, partial [Acidimicrobiales bacterium]|nr:hypothetical protein [Acidimicrobiales bacterium]
MAIGRKSIWVGIVGMTISVTGVAVAASGGGETETAVETAAPVTEAIAETVDLVPEGPIGIGAFGELPEPTTTTTTAPPTTTTAPPPPTTEAPAPAPAPCAADCTMSSAP